MQAHDFKTSCSTARPCWCDWRKDTASSIARLGPVPSKNLIQLDIVCGKL